MCKLQLDIHTHTIASGHAYSTLNEMVTAAANKGIKLIGISEHAKGVPGTCDDIYFKNLSVIPRKQQGIEVMMGSEINILDGGELSLDAEVIDELDYRIAGVHCFCYSKDTKEVHTANMVKVLNNPQIDIISHPDNDDYPLDYSIIVPCAIKNHVLLEINNNSLRSSWRKNVRENCITILTMCKEANYPVLLSSDAHFINDVGNVELAEALLKEVGFPDELVINYHLDQFKEWIQFNRNK